MKFSEMPYQRPNLDEIKAQFAAVTQRFAAAPDYAAAKAAFLDEQTLNKHVDTLANLASIRNTIDTRDEFYDDEMNFWNAATPQIQECQNTWSAALLASPYRKQLGEEYGELMFLNAEIAQKAFSPEILDEMAQENDLSTQYGKLIASAQIPFEGGVYTLSQLSPFKTTPTMPAAWPPGKPRVLGIRSIRRSSTPFTTRWSTCGTPWAKNWGTKATLPWATTAWAATATPRLMWKNSALLW